MKFEDFNVGNGYQMQLQVTNSAGQHQRLACELIGCLPGQTILLTQPNFRGRPVRLRSGQKVVGRIMIANGICVFSSAVETLSTSPYPVLHISYPNNVSFKEIRGATRVDVSLPIEVVNTSSLHGTEAQGRMGDISTTGARLELAGEAGEIGDEIRIRGQVDIAGIEREMTIKAVLRARIERTTHESNEAFPAIYGVEFVDKSEDRRLLLYSYVFYQIAKNKTVISPAK